MGFVWRVYPCDVLKLFTNPSRTFVTNSIHVSDQQCMYCKLETSDYEGICMIIVFFCIFYLLCVEKTFLYASYCSKDTYWAQQVGINIAANENQMFWLDQSFLSFYSITVFSNCHILLRGDADGTMSKPP